MSKWKCEICGSKFKSFHAQSFNNKIYCPLCYFKRKTELLVNENQKIKNVIKQIGFEPDEIAFLQQENAELKKQLEELRNGYKNKLGNLLSDGIEPDPEDFYLAEIEGKANDYDKLLIKQQEFIKYLEDYIKYKNEARQMHEMYSESENRLSSQYFILQEILQKYKEIMGVSDEKEN
jgi:hypothetical protein